MNISRMELDHGKKNFHFLPKTYIFPKEFSLFLKVNIFALGI